MGLRQSAWIVSCSLRWLIWTHNRALPQNTGMKENWTYSILFIYLFIYSTFDHSKNNWWANKFVYSFARKNSTSNPFVYSVVRWNLSKAQLQWLYLAFCSSRQCIIHYSFLKNKKIKQIKIKNQTACLLIKVAELKNFNKSRTKFSLSKNYSNPLLESQF